MSPSYRAGILWRLRRGRTNRGDVVTWVLVIAVAAILSIVVCRLFSSQLPALARTIFGTLEELMRGKTGSAPFGGAHDGQSSHVPHGALSPWSGATQPGFACGSSGSGASGIAGAGADALLAGPLASLGAGALQVGQPAPAPYERRTANPASNSDHGTQGEIVRRTHTATPSAQPATPLSERLPLTSGWDLSVVDEPTHDWARPVADWNDNGGNEDLGTLDGLLPYAGVTGLDAFGTAWKATAELGSSGAALLKELGPVGKAVGNLGAIGTAVTTLFDAAELQNAKSADEFADATNRLIRNSFTGIVGWASGGAVAATVAAHTSFTGFGAVVAGGVAGVVSGLGASWAAGEAYDRLGGPQIVEKWAKEHWRPAQEEAKQRQYAKWADDMLRDRALFPRADTIQCPNPYLAEGTCGEEVVPPSYPGDDLPTWDANLYEQMAASQPASTIMTPWQGPPLASGSALDWLRTGGHSVLLEGPTANAARTFTFLPSCLQFGKSLSDTRGDQVIGP